MTDKEFWIEIFLKSYDKLLDKLISNKKDIDIIPDEDLEVLICSLCSNSTLFADTALDFFKCSMRSLSKEAKKEIKEKNESKITYK